MPTQNQSAIVRPIPFQASFFAPAVNDAPHLPISSIRPTQYELLKSMTLNAARERNLSLLNDYALQLVGLYFLPLLRELETQVNYTNSPLYYATLFYTLTTTYPLDERSLDWTNQAAYLYALVDTERLNIAVELLVNKHRAYATTQAQQLHHHQSNPLYCAKIFEVLTRTPLPNENVAEYYRWSGYCYVLAKHNCAPRLLGSFIRLNRVQALEDANNPYLQQTHPLYCARLFNLLATNAPQSVNALAFFKKAAFYYALANESSGLTFCARQVFEGDYSFTVSEATNTTYQHTNPRYCAQLFLFLFKESSVNHNNWLWGLVYCQALAGDIAFPHNLKLLINTDIESATEDLYSDEIQRRNPVYWQALRIHLPEAPRPGRR